MMIGLLEGVDIVWWLILVLQYSKGTFSTCLWKFPLLDIMRWLLYVILRNFEFESCSHCILPLPFRRTLTKEKKNVEYLKKKKNNFKGKKPKKTKRSERSYLAGCCP